VRRRCKPVGHKDGSGAAAEIPAAAKVIGLLFASSNAETLQFAVKLAEYSVKCLVQHAMPCI